MDQNPRFLAEDLLAFLLSISPDLTRIIFAILPVVTIINSKD